MGLFRTEALVLRTIDFSESTQIARFLSPDHGKFSAMARGVKRFKSRLGPRLELFALVEARVYAKEGASMGTLSSLDAVRDWPYLRKDLERYALTALIFEAIDRGASEGKAAAELFCFAVRFLDAMADAPDPQSTAAHGLLRVLCLLGYAPDLRPPDENGPARDFYFLPDEGRLSPGAPADSRTPRLRLSAPLQDFLRASMGLTPEEFGGTPAPEGQSRPLLEFLIALARYYLETDLKTIRFIKKMIWSKRLSE